jgi:hypothetical protein
LHDLLAAALVHSPEERRLFVPIYEAWAQQWKEWEQQHLRFAESSVSRWMQFEFPQQSGSATIRRTQPWASHALRIANLLVMVVLLIPSVLAGLWLAIGLLLPTTQALTAEKPLRFQPPPPAVALAPAGLEPLPSGPPPSTIRAWIPVITVKRTALLFGTLQSFWLAIGAFALLGALILALRYRHRPWISEAQIKSGLPGPERLPLLPLTESAPVLLNAESARTLIWGVGRYLAEHRTEDLDLE